MIALRTKSTAPGAAVLVIMLAIGALQIAAYLFTSSITCVDGLLSVPQPDTPLYYQAARRIVEGHPFSFSEGSAVCSGTTTMLYPFVLAFPCWVGATGDSLIVAGFAFNALFYLVFLYGWCKAIGNWCDKCETRLLASLLIALSGHCAFATFSQTDIGFWLAFSGLFASALSVRKNVLIGMLLVFASWIRPEGMILVVAFAMMTAVFHLLGIDVKEEFRRRIVASGLGLVSVCAVFLLNYLLTGHVQFSSVAGKGHFATLPFAQAVMSSTSDFYSIVKGVVLGGNSKCYAGLYFGASSGRDIWRCRNCLLSMEP